MTEAERRWDFTLQQGATFHRVITWKRGETRETVEPVDITTFISARLQVREKVESSDTVLDLSTDSGHISLGGVLGTIELTIGSEETETLDFDGPAVYDLELETAGAEVTRFMSGRVGLSREVTREGL